MITPFLEVLPLEKDRMRLIGQLGKLNGEKCGTSPKTFDCGHIENITRELWGSMKFRYDFILLPCMGT
jgi:hypothetical protein